MTTETTATTETTVTTAIDEHHARANVFCGGNNILLITEHLADQYRALQTAETAKATLRARINEITSIVEEFIKDNLDSGASSSDLKELANELDIELTKSMTITFTVEYQADIVVPIDFDEDSISEDDFDVEISYNDHSSDVEFENDSFNINDFSVEEN